jgi:hypothetical protein
MTRATTKSDRIIKTFLSFEVNLVISAPSISILFIVKDEDSARSLEQAGYLC